jgi:hypothetical protein
LLTENLSINLTRRRIIGFFSFKIPILLGWYVPIKMNEYDALLDKEQNK